MDGRQLVVGGAAVAMVAAATVAWVMLSPSWAVDALDRVTTQQLGRSFSAKGGAHLEFSPLAIRIDEPALSGITPEQDSLATAKSLRIPVTLGQLLSRNPDLSKVELSEPEFALLIDERGRASWDFPEASPGAGLSLSLEQARFRYFDARNSQSLAVGNVGGLMTVGADGGVSFVGSAVLNARVARVDFGLKSLPRVNADGSPLDLAIETDAASASFSGRLATAKVLNLAGSLSLTSGAPADAARWAGLPLSRETVLPAPLTIEGALDSAGRAYAIRNAAVTFGQFRGAGDVVADLRGERPKLQANLQAEAVWLDTLVPASGAEPGSWGRDVLPLQLLRAFDAEVSVLARGVAYGGLTAGVSRLAATVKDGRLGASGAFRLANGGTATFAAEADAVVLPPAGSLSFKAENAELEPLLGALTGFRALTGTGSFTADLSAQGRTQEELVGTLRGSASLSLTQGRLAGTDLGGTVAAVREKILDGWAAAPGGSPLDTLNASITLADGVATLTGGEVVAQALRLSLSGTVDLLRRAVDIKAALLPAETAPLPVPVVVKGNWAAPRIYPDIPDILDNPEGGFARLRTTETPPGN